jgi:hypothetical protein
MRTSRTIPPAVYVAEQRINELIAFEAREVTVAALAAANGCAPSTLYLRKQRIVRAIAPLKTGPKPGQRDLIRRAESAELRAAMLQQQLDENRGSAEQARERSARHRLELLLLCHSNGMPLRGIQELFERLGYSARSSKSSLAEELAELGKHARKMLQWAAHSLAPSISVLAGDEVFFHGDAVKVLMEPRSAAVLDVLRWPQRGCEEWKLMLADFPALKLFVSDNGSDLCAAGLAHGAALGADFFHERRWYWRVLQKLAKLESKHADSLIELKKYRQHNTTHDRERCMLIARTELDRQRAEQAFFAVVAAEQRVVSLFMPLDPEGKLWTDETIWQCLTGAMDELSVLEGSLGEMIRNKVRKHIAHRGTQCAGHTLLWNTIEIGLRPEATMSREQALTALIERVRLEGQHLDRSQDAYSRHASGRALRALDAQLASQVMDVASASRAVHLLLKTPARSSSLVESFNARLRVLQQARRNVSEAHMSLLAFQWNTAHREEGPRREQSPWQQLGLIGKEDHRKWVDILLDALPDS